MQDDAVKWRADAAKARTPLAAVSDPVTLERLRAYAADWEAAAQRLAVEPAELSSLCPWLTHQMRLASARIRPGWVRALPVGEALDPFERSTDIFSDLGGEGRRVCA